MKIHILVQVIQSYVL